MLTLGGQWKIDSKYGRQFEVATFEETLPATVYGIEKYLGSGLIKGIGPKYAKLIVNTFGADTLNVIETDPDALNECRITCIHDCCFLSFYVSLIGFRLAFSFSFGRQHCVNSLHIDNYPKRH